MTPDGISDEDWDTVHDLALAVANASDSAEEVRCRERLLAYLGELVSRYGARPSLLATEADYVDDPAESERLLLQAFQAATATADSRNARYITLSLADFYASELRDVRASRQWLASALQYLTDADPGDWEEYTRIEQQVDKIAGEW